MWGPFNRTLDKCNKRHEEEDRIEEQRRQEQEERMRRVERRRARAQSIGPSVGKAAEWQGKKMETGGAGVGVQLEADFKVPSELAQLSNPSLDGRLTKGTVASMNMRLLRHQK
ncbi:hypothetical protein BN1708_004488 [Verticillium longisporum]|uniref:Uncharacterized protein n=1 Tax=Verticillium longisporum TaxID=100787 RepID=A0A0G4M1X1_VERLO|nr:hypothetical protein BN1708_004488 [Verticillium longisporum]